MLILTLAMGAPGVFPSFVNVIVASPCLFSLYCFLFFYFYFVFMLCCFSPGLKWSTCLGVPCTRLLFPDLPSLATLGALLAHCSEQRATLIMLIYWAHRVTAVPTAARQSSTSGELHPSSDPELVTAFVSSFSGVIHTFLLFLSVVHFSLNDRHFNTCPMVQFSLLWKQE